MYRAYNFTSLDKSLLDVWESNFVNILTLQWVLLFRSGSVNLFLTVMVIICL